MRNKKSLVIIALVSYCFLLGTNCKKARSNEKNSIFGQENAIWTESIYLRGVKPSTGRKLTEEDLKIYAKTLKENGIKYAYLFAGPYKRDGHLNDYPFSDLAKNSIKSLRKYYPEIIILPWIGGIQNETVHLGDSSWVNNALHDTKRLIKTHDLKGVHIDLEYILDGDEYLEKIRVQEKTMEEKEYGKAVNKFLKKVRNTLPQSFISSVVTATAPGTKPWKRKTTMKELDETIKYVDQLSFLYYDTGIHSQEVFETNCVSQIQNMLTLKQKNPNIQLLLSVGTFVNEPALQKYRNIQIENIKNTLEVIKRSSLKVNPNKRIVDGISIYCDWETTQEEWKEFYMNWVL